MTEPKDWLDEVLARDPAEPVPPGFKFRLLSRIQAESADRGRRPFSRLPLLLAAGFLLLAAGFWLGMGAPRLSGPIRIESPGDSASLELAGLYEHRDLLEAWELLQDPELELGFVESAGEAAR